MRIRFSTTLIGATAGAMVVGLAIMAAPATAMPAAEVAAARPAGDSQVLVRKDVKDLSAAEKRAFVRAVLRSKRVPDPLNPSHSYYDRFVLWHKLAFSCDVSWDQGGNWAGAAHNSPTFLPWHRQYLIEFERMLRDVSGNPSITLPYWDWSDPASTAAVFADDFMGGNGDPSRGYAVTTGPFRKGRWTIDVFDPKVLVKGMARQTPYLQRNFGAFAGDTVSLPSRSDVHDAIHVSGYDHHPYDASASLAESFRNMLEGWREAKPATCDDGWVNVSQKKGSPHALHNVVHIWTGGVWESGGKTHQGTMAYNTSPNDPVFFLHHANVDRIFAAWEKANRSAYRPISGAPFGWNATDTMWPWYDRTINSWFGTRRNGYVYASLPR